MSKSLEYRKISREMVGPMFQTAKCWSQSHRDQRSAASPARKDLAEKRGERNVARRPYCKKRCKKAFSPVEVRGVC